MSTLTLRDKIEAFRKYGITPAHIAREAGISRTTLGKWLDGSRPDMTVLTREKIENAMRDIVDELNDVVYAQPIEGEYEDDF